MQVHSLIVKTFLFQVIQFSQTVLIQTIQFSKSVVFVPTKLNVEAVLFKTIQFSIITQFKCQTVLFQVIQFNKSTQFSSISSIDRTLSGVTTPGQSGPGSDGNEGMLCIPQSSSITRPSALDCLVSYAVHSLGESYSSAEMQSVYSAALADRATCLLRYFCSSRYNVSGFLEG